ncbi:MAG TPA: tetratricopeptide repeat protein [Ignavibacteriaceae bacterium]|nr:tetratricopeptide repeat protein [Ignavibacteriaceae bacterium]
MTKKYSKNKPEKATPKKPIRKWFYILLVIIPLLFIILLEVSLRIINYGNDYTLFVPISKRFPDKLYINPNICKKYFSNVEHPPLPLADAIDKDKKTNSFRIFVLGGSSAEGYPFVPNASFPRELKRRLELLYPERTIEVMNCGMSAINSYTLRDFIPSIIKQSPDLVLIYAGHNEYYGALGVGSSVTILPSRFLTNFYLWLQNFKTTQLMNNIIKTIIHFFKTSSSESNNTLMETMIGQSLIPLNSKIYEKGLEQFKGNMKDILKMLNDAKVPVIIGNLTCNKRDFKPFESKAEDHLPPADSIFNLAVRSLEDKNLENGKKLFEKARDLDELRFRAPSDINKIISNLGKDYNVPVVNIDSIFDSQSPFGITGNNLMVDHLHPNLDGYKLLAKSFYQKMLLSNCLPSNPKNISDEKQESILSAAYPLTKLDSALGKIEIERLTRNFPFVPKGSVTYNINDYKANNFIDSVAKSTLLKLITWEEAHAKVAQWYWDKREVKNFLREINAIIAERPYDDEPYDYLTTKLISNQLYDEAKPYLEKLNSLKPSAFTNKWLGQIALNKNSFKEAITYLNKSLQFNNSDPQVWYNLAGAYYNSGQLDEAINALKNCLRISPNYKPAQTFYESLKALK